MNLGMDRPNFNLSFKGQLISMLGTCALQKLNLVLGDAVAEIHKLFDVDQFALNLHFSLNILLVGDMLLLFGRPLMS